MTRLWILVAVVGSVFTLFPKPAETQVIERVSVDSIGIEANGWSSPNGRRTVMSDDGRFVVFQSDATNLVADDFNGWRDVFIRDRELGSTARVSVSTSGGDGNGPSDTPAISADGRYVVFRSAAGNLVDGDLNFQWDIFRRDLQLGMTERVSVNPDGGDSNDDSSNPVINADGRYVAFVSQAWNLVPGGSNRFSNIFVRDMNLAATALVSVAWDGGGVEANDWGPAISGDGRTVAFVSTASSIVPDDFNDLLDVFVRDLDQAVTIRASVDEAGGDADHSSRTPSLNFDGSHVAFQSTATDLVPDDTNGMGDIFVRVLGNDPYTHRVNLHSDGSQALDFGSWGAAIGASARYVAFLSDAQNLVDDDSNGFGDAFVHDRWNAVTRRISTDRNGGQADGWSGSASFSSDEQYMVISSVATNLIEGDTNGIDDVFVAMGPGTLFVDGFESGDSAGWSATGP